MPSTSSDLEPRTQHEDIVTRIALAHTDGIVVAREL
jgi:hypothetical protein